MSTPNIPESTDLTFEKILMLFKESEKQRHETYKELRAMFQETDRELRAMFKESEKQRHETDRELRAMFKESEKQRHETDKELRAMFKESEKQRHETDKELRAMFQETDRRLKETDKIIKRLGKQFGDLGIRFGEVVEHLVAPGIVKVFNKRGYHFHEVASNIEIKDDNNRTLTEIDLLLENDKTTVAVEVKAKPTINDIPHHIGCLKILREHFRKHKRAEADKEIIGVIAGAVFAKDIKVAAIEAGFYTITQSGDTIKLDIPTDFQPRIF